MGVVNTVDYSQSQLNAWKYYRANPYSF